MKRILSALICLIIIFGTVLPIVANDTAAGEENTEQNIVEVLIWAEDIKRGFVIDEDSLTIKKVFNENVPINALKAEDAEILYGMYAKNDLYSGEYVFREQLSVNSVKKVNNDLLIKPIVTDNSDFLIVTDYLVPNTGEDLSSFLQEMIDKNPNRTIYFPDGEYMISESLRTSAVGEDTVSIQLSDGAVIKATSNFRTRSGVALITLGDIPRNNIKELGHYYIISGGTLDGSNVACGIQIKSGRETVVKNICIKDTRKGIIINEGANSKSADCDFEDITIIGNGMAGTIGIENLAYDNTYTNIRIYDMALGFDNTMGGEIANIYVFFTEKSKNLKQGKVGISNKGGRMSHCVTVNCDTGFNLSGNMIIFDCTAEWTSDTYKKQNAFYTQEKIILSGCKAYFCDGDGVTTTFANDKAIIEGCFY